jgi:hypothetical protein
MTWSISRSGARTEVLDAVRSELFPNLADGSPEKGAAERWRDAIAAVLEADGNSDASVSASGYSNRDGGSSVSVSVSTWPTAVAAESPPTAPEAGFVGLVVAIALALFALIASVASSVTVASAPTPSVARADALAEATWITARPELERAAAPAHAIAAIAAERGAITAETLLAMGYSETRYDGAHVGGRGKFCGVVQATATGADDCASLADLGAGYAAGADQLAIWVRACSSTSRRGAWPSAITCALAGYGGGWRAVRAGTSSYPARVIARARRIRRLERSLGGL